MTAGSPSSSTALPASGSTRRTTSSSNPTIRSGSPTRRSESLAITKESGRSPNCRPTSIASTVVADDINAPNGLAFSPDERLLYIVESRSQPRRIRVFDVVDDGTRLARGRVFVDAGAGTPDGLRVDVDGNLWCGWGMDEALNGVVVFAPD